MTQEDKELLLKDLCARLPYETILLSPNEKITYQTDGNTAAELLVEEGWKSYLRPISSMTEEEVNELFHILKINEKNTKEWIKVNDIGIIRLFTEEGKDFYEIADAIDYLHSIHIDYRGLIEKGLAIEAPEGMYK